MGLTQEQIAAKQISFNEVFGLSAQVWFFGSRVDDRKCGGDIDLLVCPAKTGSNSSLASKICKRFPGVEP